MSPRPDQTSTVSPATVDKSALIAPGRRNRELQWLRALAATCVVVYHSGVYLERFTGDGRFVGVFDGRLGFLGVAIFFALSGYLMAEILPRTDPAIFLAHRVVRIYPIFLGVFAALYIARRKWWDFDLLALTLVPVGEGRTYYLGVEWTLLFEVSFYVFLYLVSLLGMKRHIPVLAFLWLSGTALATWSWPVGQTILTPTIDQLPLMAVNAGFAGGLLIPTLRRWNLLTPFVASLAVLVSFGFGLGGFGGDRWVASICAVILVGLCVSRPADVDHAKGGILRLLDRYGDWSYALYLCHVPLIIVLMIGRPPIPSPLLWALGIVLPFLVAIPFGITDVAVYRRTRRWVDAAPRMVLRLAAAAYAALFLGIAMLAANDHLALSRFPVPSSTTEAGPTR